MADINDVADQSAICPTFQLMRMSREELPWVEDALCRQPQVVLRNEASWRDVSIAEDEADVGSQSSQRSE